MEPNQNQPHVVVCGAGIGGLTVAHELLKRGIRVTVFERNDVVGGLARSGYAYENGYKYPVEYSWRVYGTGYKNLHRILQEIPLRHQKEASVRDRLKKARTYIFPRTGKPELIFSPYRKENKKSPALSLRDNLSVLNKILQCVTMSRARMHSMDHMKWKDFCADLSPEANNYMVKLWGPVLGMDPSHMSFPVVAPFVPLLLARYAGTASGVYLLDRPTNDGWFSEWTAHLTQSGLVDIHTNTAVQNVRLANGIIQSVLVEDLKTSTRREVEADYVVCGMGVEAMDRLIASNRDLKQVRSLSQLAKLARVSHQIQLSVQLFLTHRVVYPTTEPPILYFPNSPWALIIEPQAMVWGKTFSTDPSVKAVLSVGICQTDAPGTVVKKPFTACTEAEIETEVVAQMQDGYEAANIRMSDGKKLSQEYIKKFYIWDSFSFHPKTKRMETWEPKFSNNAGAGRFMPETTTEILNLFFATGYTKTDRFIYSMESAAEAGTRCANTILEKIGTYEPTPVFRFKQKRGPLAPLAWIDRACFALRLPSPGIIGGLPLVLIYLLVLLGGTGALVRLLRF